MDIQQARQLAQDEKTSNKVLVNLVAKYSDILHFELIGELEGKKYRELFNCILTNPNTPSNILKRYFMDFSTQVLNNPDIHLILLKQPDFFDNINFDLRFFDKKQLPIWFFKLAKNHSNSSLRSAVAIEKSTPIYILEELCMDKEAAVRSGVYFNSKCPGYIKDILDKMLEKNNWLIFPF